MALSSQKPNPVLPGRDWLLRTVGIATVRWFCCLATPGWSWCRVCCGRISFRTVVPSQPEKRNWNAWCFYGIVLCRTILHLQLVTSINMLLPYVRPVHAQPKYSLARSTEYPWIQMRCVYLTASAGPYKTPLWLLPPEYLPAQITKDWLPIPSRTRHWVWTMEVHHNDQKPAQRCTQFGTWTILWKLSIQAIDSLSMKRNSRNGT